MNAVGDTPGYLQLFWRMPSMVVVIVVSGSMFIAFREKPTRGGFRFLSLQLLKSLETSMMTTSKRAVSHDKSCPSQHKAPPKVVNSLPCLVMKKVLNMANFALSESVEYFQHIKVESNRYLIKVIRVGFPEFADQKSNYNKQLCARLHTDQRVLTSFLSDFWEENSLVLSS